MNTRDKIKELQKIAVEISTFKDLDIAKNCTHSVPGEGNPDAKLMFIGEAPGRVEDETGRPFVGQSGQLMRRTLVQTTGLKPEEVFITNIVKYRPPDNRDPLPDEIAACKNWLDRQIMIIRPQVIATLGRFSMGKFLKDVTISKIHGRTYHIRHDDFRCLLYPMYHPAAALRSSQVMQDFVGDFQKLIFLLEN